MEMLVAHVIKLVAMVSVYSRLLNSAKTAGVVGLEKNVVEIPAADQLRAAVME